jgi:hypothetical protein
LFVCLFVCFFCSSGIFFNYKNYYHAISGTLAGLTVI